MVTYGECDQCKTALQPSGWFKEEEYTRGVKTGRVRTALNGLECPCCFKKFIIDDTFDGAWHNKH